MAKKLLLLPGDGIGPEVTAQVSRVVAWLNDNAGLDLVVESRDFGGTAYDKHGSPLPDETRDLASALADRAACEVSAKTIEAAALAYFVAHDQKWPADIGALTAGTYFNYYGAGDLTGVNPAKIFGGSQFGLIPVTSATCFHSRACSVIAAAKSCAVPILVSRPILVRAETSIA